MNVTVINLRNLIKYLVVLITSILVIVTATRFFYSKNNLNVEKCKSDQLSSALQRNCLELIIPLMNYTEGTTQASNIEKTNILTKLLSVELGLIDSVEKKENVNEIISVEQTQNEEITNIDEANNNQIKLAETNLETREVTENNIKPSYTDSIDTIQIKNQSSYKITSELINEPFVFSNTKDIIIFHTHTCESYTPTENYQYTASGTYRTTDLNYSVSRVGDELDNQLTAYGYNIIHDKTYHDYPAYTGSYDRSLKTVQSVIKDNSSTANVIIDLHRDAVGSSGEYGPSVMIGDEKVAQLMFVMGTDGGGLYHPNWRENLKFAVAVQRKANEMYPGLFRPIILRDTRYNQHLASGACIIEVGATGNTMEECLGSMKYLAKVMSEVIK